MPYDAILIPSGGLLADNSLPPWVERRYDRAIELHQGEYVVPLSAGTTHKPLPLDEFGLPVFEAIVGARYLASKGIEPGRILAECTSWDTIGNAYFARVIHADPLGWRRLLVINSAFHMPRTEAIFRWVFGLQGRPYDLTFVSTEDAGIRPSALLARREREAASLARVQALSRRITTLPAMHEWLFREHAAYAWNLTATPEAHVGNVAETY